MLVFTYNNFQLVLPTDDISSVTAERVDGWIEIVHGPLTSQCEATQAQFELLLDVVLTYRAFALGSLGASDFELFADRLIETASELHPFERADDELAEFVGWLHVNFAKVSTFIARPPHYALTLHQSIFDTAGLDLSWLPMQSPLEPPRRFRPPVAQTLAHAGNGLANELRRLSILEHQATDIERDTAPPSEPAGMSPVASSIPAPLAASKPGVPRAPKTPKRAHRAPANTGSDSDSDGGSDMPSLKTVDCSSCGGEDSGSDGEALWSSDAEGEDK